MRNEVKTLLDAHLVRKTKKQKAAFREWLCGVLTAAGYAPRVESNKSGSTNNVVLGDPHTAKVIYTAHYDTPARMPFPNFIVPGNMLWTLVCQLPLMVIMFAPAFIVRTGLEHLGLDRGISMIGFGVCIYAALFLMLLGPANPSNVNDNSSGVATLIELALSLPEELRSDVCIVFFDNEEKGLVGSSAFYKLHKGFVQATPVINFDCVSDGDFIRFYPTSKLKKNPAVFMQMCETFNRSDEPSGKSLAVLSGGYYPSDQKHFPLGLGCAALHKNKIVGLCLGRIHTSRDTIYDEKNIELIRSAAVDFAARVSQKSEDINAK